ncbi:mitochondrial 3-hydroxyisobutyryl-hydrolase [Plasmopara halstedii]|uniref:3-hydroxyisobutyryl-CoA hydrolase n=1 Tax=Plasmopara halstedii TaxID=4781 RepID=A0A0P1A9M6_PLAHL|nr:mitochondrial 3-hydroxyisobutyryl-hydrolase [Plasmopara halstedii]CEG37157.1 mitochondrial 3-hydroxyisobutyryl-hydrolase [Plasmopara halstedii]|eukprot:XP_024573526.1 mitochondrial 3-hydroxyisobutyryl-hydrolase [Plasmopara halstedii]
MRLMAMRLRLLQRPVRSSNVALLSTKAPDFSDIVYGQDTGVRTVQFNRPEKLNALTLPMALHLMHRLHKFEANKTVNAIVFSGNGGKAFCAGGDIRALADNGKDPATRHFALDFFRHEYRLNYLLATTEKPIISFLNGVTMGGGVGLSMHGKFVVATEKTVFAMPETAIGFFPDVGASYLLPRLGRRLVEGEDYVADVPKSQALKGQGLGTYLALTGERLKGHEVIGLGLATHYLPTSEYDTLVHQLTGFEFEDQVPQEERDEMIHEAIAELETDEAFQEVDPGYLETVEQVFGASNENDTLEGIFGRLEKLNTEWSHETLANLKKMSPLSLKVTLEQMRQGAGKTYAECFQMEYRIATRMMENPDFFEGVRSVVVDKDRNPKWSKRDITKVTAKEVNAFFKPLEKDQELILYPSVTATTEKE